MPKLVLNDITSLANTASAKQALNDNFTAIETAIENTLSRNGATPNQMTADIDLNGFDLLNVKRIDADEIFKNGTPFEQTVAYANKNYQLLSGTGAQTSFTLTEDPGSLGNLYVSIAGLDQKPGIDYNYAGTTLTFVVAPASGTNNIYVRYDKALPTGVTDTSAISFLQAGTGMVTRTAQAKMRDIVHADDEGLLGDGTTDETTKLQNLFNAAQGKLLILGYNKTYAIATATGLSIPANTTLISNGSKIKRLTPRSGSLTDAEYNIIVNDDCIIDKLEVQAVGGASDIGGVLIAGSRYNIGTLKVTAGSSGSGSLGSSWNAVRVGPNSGTSSNGHIGEIVVTNWDRPVVYQNSSRWTLGRIDITTYARGIYIKDCSHYVINSGHIRTLSPNGTGSAGENGMLFESTTAHWSNENGRICNVTVENAGEHSFRVGGQLNARNLFFENCHSIASGSGGATAVGGCGFKALGATSVFGARHVNIHFSNCSAFDINLAGASGASNFAGLQLAKVFGASVTNFVCGVTPAASGTYAETGNSAQNGIEIIGCQKVTITNPQVQRPSNSGIYIYDFTDGVNDWGQTDDISIDGGEIQTPTDAGVEIDCSVITMRRIKVNGLQSNGGAYSAKVNKSGTGAFVGLHFGMVCYSPATETFNGLGTDATVHAVGNFVGTNACRNGSIFQDITNASVKHRRGGAWTPITGSATYDPPSLADGAGTTTTVTATGAALGDFATASFSLDTQGITVTAWVSAANTVSVRFQNESGGTLDLASGTLRVFVERT